MRVCIRTKLNRRAAEAHAEAPLKYRGIFAHSHVPRLHYYNAAAVEIAEKNNKNKGKDVNVATFKSRKFRSFRLNNSKMPGDSTNKCVCIVRLIYFCKTNLTLCARVRMDE